MCTVWRVNSLIPNCHQWATLLNSKIWVRFSWQTPGKMQFSTRSTHVLYVLLRALCFTGGMRVVKWKQIHWSVLERGLHPCREVNTSLLGSQSTTFSLLLLDLWIKTVSALSTDDKWKDLERCWPSTFYLRCSMTEISPLSRSKPFMNKPPFLVRGVVRPCCAASLSFLSSLKLTDTALLGIVNSGPGLNPSSEDSLRLIEVARWNLS